MSFGSFDQNDGDAPMAEINVTPLVDVMLVLLIVFMITMPVLTHSIPLTLPTSSTEKISAEPVEPLRVSINLEDGYHYDNRPLDLAELEHVFQEEKVKNPDVILAIAADKDIAYEKVTDVLEIAQEAGIAKIGFVTEQKDD